VRRTARVPAARKTARLKTALAARIASAVRVLARLRRRKSAAAVRRRNATVRRRKKSALRRRRARSAAATANALA